jgi:cytochrome P450
MTIEVPRAAPVAARLLTQPSGVLASYLQSQQDLLELIPQAAVEQPVVSGVSGTRWHMVMEPDAIKRVLQTRAVDYPKSDMARAILRPAVGDSMIVAEGDDWRRQRALAAPAFQPRHVTGLGPIMSRAAQAGVDRLTLRSGRTVNMLDEVTRATFDVIADVTFSGRAGLDRASVHAAIEAYGAAAGKMSFLDVLGAPAWVPRPARMRSAPALQAMKDLADQSIADRTTGVANDPPDLLDLLLSGVHDGKGLSQIDLRDNLLAFIVAGHETTALTLAWALYLCGFDQQVQTRARHEARDVLQGRVATADDVAKLPYIRQVIDETMRLYPPAAFLSRVAREPDELCGAQVLPGDIVTIPVYAVHRHQHLWQRPDHFDPENFANPKSIRRYSYLPFGDGPRICIGARFAVQEAVIILSTLLSRFRFAPVPGKTPKPSLIITLRPEGGVWLSVTPA